MVTINLTENTTECVSTNIVKENSTNIDVCKIEVPFNYSISIGDEVNLYDENSTLIYKGLVQNITIAGIKEITLYDYGVQLMDINVNEIYSDTLIEDIIEDIVNKTDMTFVSTIVTTIPTGNYIIKDKTGWEVVTELTELLNAAFRVDKNKNFYLELIEEDSSIESITTENALIDGDWNEDADQLVNKIILIGDKQLFEKTKSFSGTGSQTTFLLSEFPVDVNVTVGGIEQTGYVEGVTDTADYKVDKATKSIIFQTGSIPASGTDNVIVRYTFSIDIKLTSQNTASIEQYGGDNNIAKEKKITKPYITSFQEARDYANYYLGIYSQPLLTSTWVISDYTKFENFVPNQKIIVTDTIRSITRSLIIKKVEREYPGQLKVDVGWKEDNILDWNKEVQYRIKQLEEVDDNSTILQEYELIENNVNIEVSTIVERQLERTLPDDYLYLAPEIGEILNWWQGDNSVFDRSGNNNPMVWTGTPSYTTGLQYDYAFDFDGTNYVDSTITTTPTKTEGSISFWVKFSTDQLAGLLQLGQNSPSFYLVDDYLGIIWEDATGLPIDDEYFTEVQLNKNVWNNIVLNWKDGENISLHINNIDIESTSSPVLSDIITNVITSPNYDFEGQITDIRLYSEQLDEGDRQSIYNEGNGLVNNADFSEIGDGTERPLGDTISDLELWLKLNGDALDYSGNGNDGTWVGTEQYDTGKQFDLAGDFDGSSSININNSTTQNPFTISLFFKVNDLSLGFMGLTWQNWNYRIFIDDDENDIRFLLLDSTGGAKQIDSNFIPVEGVFYHIFASWDGSTMKLYINNIEYGSTSLSSIRNETVNFYIGSSGTTHYFDGVIGDFRIYNKILSTQERTAIYNDGLGAIDNLDNIDRFYITDKDYWGDPDYEIDETGSLQSWSNIL